MTDQVANKYLRLFLDRHTSITYNKGDILIFQGEAPKHAFVVKEGVVKAYNLSVNGDEKPVAFYKENSIFPGPWVYGATPSSLYYYEVSSPTATIYTVKKEELADFIKNRPELLYNEFRKYILEQLGLSIRLNALQHSRASDKLIYTLHYLAINNGHLIKPKVYEIKLSLTHQDFANLTGLTRETAATELNRLKKNGVIHYSNGSNYTLYLDKLTQMINDQFIADMPINL